MDDQLLKVDPLTERSSHRLTTLHALKIDDESTPILEQHLPDWGTVGDYFHFGRLGSHYRAASTQFPAVLICQEHIRCPFNGPRAADGIDISHCRSWLFQVPHGGLVAATTIDFTGPLRTCIPLLEDAYYGELSIGRSTLLEALQDAALPSLAPCLATASLSTHGHQLLFLSADCEDLVTIDDTSARNVNHDLVRRLIYRYDAPYRQDSGLIRFPPEANRGMRSLVACGPYFSIFACQQDYVENAALVAAIQLVGSSELLSKTRTHAYESLTILRSLHGAIDETNHVEYRQVRRSLAELSERVGRLELDLSFGIEAYHEIAALVPSLRVSGLHRELFEAAALPEQTRSIAQMLDRLARAVSAESASVLASERNRDERRRLVWGVAIGFASFVAIPLTLTFGFFAVATPDVSSSTSLLNVGHYRWFYVTIAGIMLVTLFLASGAWLYTRDRE